MKRLIYLVVASALLLVACQPRQNDYSEFADINPDGWRYGEVLTFKPEVADSIVVGTLELAIRHTNDYPYSNLWLELTHPVGDTVVADTLNIELADPYGHWHGRGMGVDFQHSIVLSDEFPLHNGRPISVRHIMRVDTLADIEQVGFIFKPRE